MPTLIHVQFHATGVHVIMQRTTKYIATNMFTLPSKKRKGKETETTCTHEVVRIYLKARARKIVCPSDEVTHMSTFAICA